VSVLVEVSVLVDEVDVLVSVPFPPPPTAVA